MNNIRIPMFISSHIPLWLSIAILTVPHNTITSRIMVYVMMFLTISSFIGLTKHIKAIKKISFPQKYIIKNAKRQKILSSEYLLSYIIPLIAFDFTNTSNIFLFFLYIVILGYLCVKNYNIYTNIILEIKGYSFFVCDIEFCLSTNKIVKENVLIISRTDIIRLNGQNPEMQLVKLDDDIFIE